jgi:hypothetical protein
LSVAWERLLSARLLPFGQRPLSARSCRSATFAIRPFRLAPLEGVGTLATERQPARGSKLWFMAHPRPRKVDQHGRRAPEGEAQIGRDAPELSAFAAREPGVRGRRSVHSATDRLEAFPSNPTSISIGHWETARPTSEFGAMPAMIETHELAAAMARLDALTDWERRPRRAMHLRHWRAT